MTDAYCTIFRDGTIVDGTGAPACRGDVVVAEGRIAAVIPGDSRSASEAAAMGGEVVDCSGCVIAPGFIDAHSHSDLQILHNRTEKLLQGVTTEVVGNCGFSAYPAPADPQQLRDFANGILCGNNHWSWTSASDYLRSAAIPAWLPRCRWLVTGLCASRSPEIPLEPSPAQSSTACAAC